MTKSGKPMPYRCRKCRRYFSVKVGSCMQSSNLGCQKWGIAIYMITTSLKGVLLRTESAKELGELAVAQVVVDEAAVMQRQAGPPQVAGEGLRQMGTQQRGRLLGIGEDGTKQPVVRPLLVVGHRPSKRRRRRWRFRGRQPRWRAPSAGRAVVHHLVRAALGEVAVHGGDAGQPSHLRKWPGASRLPPPRTQSTRSTQPSSMRYHRRESDKRRRRSVARSSAPSRPRE